MISWFTSVGYFDDEENRLVLREARRCSGRRRLLIENNNLADLLLRWLPSVVIERDGKFSIDLATFDPITGRVDDRASNRPRRADSAVRLLGPDSSPPSCATGFCRPALMPSSPAIRPAPSDRPQPTNGHGRSPIAHGRNIWVCAVRVGSGDAPRRRPQPAR